MNREKIGVILGRKPATTGDFYIAVDRDKVVQLDDTVFTETEINMNGRKEKVCFYGIVDSVERSYEGLDFDSDMYYIDSVPIEERHVAHVRITMVEPDYIIPPRPGADVFLARGERFQKAIGADRMKRKLPAGLSVTTEEPVYIDLDFVDGKKGAHINISGISGIATKTTYGIFLLHEIMRYMEKFPEEPRKEYVGIIFNVKGEDLLFMDKPNKDLYENPEREKIFNEWRKISPDIYEDIILKKKGLSNFRVRFYAPPKKQGGEVIPDVQTRGVGETFTFGWTTYSFAENEIIRYATSEEDNENIKSLIDDISALLKKLAEHTKEQEGTENKEPNYIISPFNKKKIETFEDIEEFIGELFSPKKADVELEKISIIRSKYSTATQRACITRIHRIKDIGRFIGPEFTDESENKNVLSFEKLMKMRGGDLYVFHLGALDETNQRIVVGSILSKIFKQQVAEGSQRKVVIFLDELSKYAPREGTSPIKTILEDIAERGRSLGVILIGAQQSARTVSRKIIFNSSIKVVGRMSPEEIEESEYAFLPREIKMRLLISQPGKLVINQPGILAPVMIKFPFPFWATRKEEVYENDTKEKEYEEKLEKIETGEIDIG